MSKKYIKAMLFGFMLGDGWVSQLRKGNYKFLNAGFSGDTESLDLAKDDLRIIYGNIGKATTYIKNTSSPKYGIAGTTVSFVVNQMIGKSFVKLGMPIGKRTENEFLLPDWIINGDFDTKRAFLSGLYAAEGFTPLMQKNDKTLKPLGFTITKRLALKENFDQFLQQLSLILNDLKIGYALQITETYTCDRNLTARFDFNNNNENILHVVSILDIRYCQRKQLDFKLVKQYYELKSSVLKRLEEAYKIALLRISTAKQIAVEYNITQRQVEKWRERKTGIRIPNSFPTFTQFKAELSI